MKFMNYKSADSELRKQAFELYLNSFPEYEIRSESCHSEALSDSEFTAEIVVDDSSNLQAILFHWRHEGVIYIEHIAVNPLLRGQNVGSSVLTSFIAEHKDSVIILEIDPPIDDVAVRRLRFYSHLGFVANDYPYTHPSFSVGGHVHELVILSHGRKISQSEFDDFVNYMNSRVLKYTE